jgi:hypothetical protein
MTMANAPLGDGTARLIESDLGQARKQIFLQRGLDRKVAGQPVGQITKAFLMI